MCAEGLAFLREKEIAIKVILAPHGSKADFDEIVTMYGDVLASSRFVGIESEWRDNGPAIS